MSDASPLNRIAALPVTFFTITMGLSGFTLSFRALENSSDLTPILSTTFGVITLVVFLTVAAGYLIKIIRFNSAVKEEWCHPVKLAFFPAISISMLLLAAIFLPYSQWLATLVWLTAVVLQVILTVSVISGWISHRSFEHGHLTPAWFIPAVGNVIAPLAGQPLGFVEVSWFFMAAGLFFWLVLTSLVLNRLIFHDPLPERLMPTLVILIAPPAVGFISWIQLVQEIDVFARLLLNIGYLFALIVAVQLPSILKVEFSMSFWALSFPLAALTSASLTYGDAMGSPTHTLIGMSLLALLCLIIAGLVIRTLGAILSGAAFEA